MEQINTTRAITGQTMNIACGAQAHISLSLSFSRSLTLAGTAPQEGGHWMLRVQWCHATITPRLLVSPLLT